MSVFVTFVVLVSLYFRCCWLLMYFEWFSLGAALVGCLLYAGQVVWGLLGYSIFELFAFIK